MKPKFTGLKRTASVPGISKSKTATADKKYPYYFICINNAGCQASLDLGRAYKVIRPRANDASYDLRVIDNEGEDYLYDTGQFAVIDLPPRARRAIDGLATSGIARLK